MSLDRRLREELQREAARIDPDIGRGMGAVEARARRRTTVGLGSLLVAATAAVLVIVAVQALQLAPPDTQPAATAPPTGDVVGTYRATLQPSDGGTELGDVAGEWTMELMPDGVMLVAPPATFREGASVQSGVSYSIDGERFRTNLFQQLCNSIGDYGWVLDGGTLTLTPVEDDCALRRAVLASTPWATR